MLGVSSTYLSQVEQQKFPPVTASRAACIAEILDDDPDLWIGFADRITEYLEPIFRKHPTSMPTLIRLAGQHSADELQETIVQTDTRPRSNRSSATLRPCDRTAGDNRNGHRTKSQDKLPAGHPWYLHRIRNQQAGVRDVQREHQ